MDEEAKRPVFGNRFLSETDNVFQHNAWDNVEWTKEQETEARKITQGHSCEPLPEDEKDNLLNDASSNWDKFYEKHNNKFFKDRHWLFTEFPELLSITSKSASSVDDTAECSHNDDEGHAPCSNKSDGLHFPGSSKQSCVLEIGCGAGNTIFPLLQVNTSNELFVYGCDYSSTAVDIIKSHRDFDDSRCHVFAHDITSDAKFPFPEQSLDIIVMIFVLSALEFDKMKAAVHRIVQLLKPGGKLLFRDYGRYDMAQLRFKKNRCLSENFYTRGDGTLVYFFTQDEVRDIFTSAGLVENQNIVDRRLQVNRARQLKMYRVWVQAKYVKPL
uniref:tRNA N(3)-methylcytidine methyltransferase n=1 Tax=Phallusia mammillata TaxID=59560 RepID=A0A6F9DLB7_9ASCI|nr:methyltransferase-like protein 6 [Phallusia mammillata]